MKLSESILRKKYDEIRRNFDSNMGIEVGAPFDNNFFIWRSYIIVLPDTPYKGGIFLINFHFPDNYPSSPPKVKFLTPI